VRAAGRDVDKIWSGARLQPVVEDEAQIGPYVGPVDGALVQRSAKGWLYLLSAGLHRALVAVDGAGGVDVGGHRTPLAHF
jgi:hypothetical protein